MYLFVLIWQIQGNIKQHEAILQLAFIVSIALMCHFYLMCHHLKLTEITQQHSETNKGWEKFLKGTMDLCIYSLFNVRGLNTHLHIEGAI